MIRLILALSVAAHLAPGVDLIPGKFVPNTQPDGNSVIFHAPRGLIVVDTGRHPTHTNAILDFAQQSHLPIRAVINTHWHLDHIGGNLLVRRRFPGVRVYASSALADARKGFLANYRKQLEEMIATTTDAAAQEPWRAEEGIIDSGDALAPDDVIVKSETRSIAGRKLMIGLESRAVTAGDVWVFDPAPRILASGDLVTLPVPFFDTACPARWKDSLDHLAAVDFTMLIPGHGAPMNRNDFEVYRAAFDNLLTCAAADKNTKSTEQCVSGWLSDAAPLLKSEDPKFVRMLLGYYIEEQLRGDPSRIAKLCGT